MPRARDKPRHGAERALLLLGALVLTISTVILRFSEGTDSVSPVLGPVGLGVLALSGLAWAIRSFGAGPPAQLPTTVGSRRLSADRGLRWRMALTLVLAVGVPLAPAIAVVGMFDEGWMWVSITLMFGGAGAGAEHARQRRARGSEEDSAEELAALVARLCMRADMAVPELVIEKSRVPDAWTHGGRVHLSDSLRSLLEPKELEAVLAHELAHLAHRDAAVMDLATAPSRLLLGLVAFGLHPGRLGGTSLHERLSVRVFSVFFVPPAFVLGWSSRLLGLGLSRFRELAADASAATLTGRPSALASALLELEAAQSGIPRRDLREMEVRGPLCIVEVRDSRMSRLLRTQPTTADRVARLERMEERLQAQTTWTILPGVYPHEG